MSHVRISACVSLAAVLFSRRSGGCRAAASLVSASPPAAPQGGIKTTPELKTTCTLGPLLRTQLREKGYFLQRRKKKIKSYFCAPAQSSRWVHILSRSGLGFYFQTTSSWQKYPPSSVTRTKRRVLRPLVCRSCFYYPSGCGVEVTCCPVRPLPRRYSSDRAQTGGSLALWPSSVRKWRSLVQPIRCLWPTTRARFPVLVALPQPISH